MMALVGGEVTTVYFNEMMALVGRIIVYVSL